MAVTDVLPVPSVGGVVARQTTTAPEEKLLMLLFPIDMTVDGKSAYFTTNPPPKHIFSIQYFANQFSLNYGNL